MKNLLLNIRRLKARLVHSLIVKYLRKVGGAFHHFQYGKNGRYICVLTEEEYHYVRNIQ